MRIHVITAIRLLVASCETYDSLPYMRVKGWQRYHILGNHFVSNAIAPSTVIAIPIRA